jgi:hypothetical protein
MASFEIRGLFTTQHLYHKKITLLSTTEIRTTNSREGFIITLLFLLEHIQLELLDIVVVQSLN